MQDQQQFLLYLDSLLKDVESRLDTTYSLTPSPMRGSEHGHLQTLEHGDNVGIHEVLSVDVGDEGLLLGDVGYNSDAVSIFLKEVQLTEFTPSDHPDLPVRLNTLGTSLLSLFEHTENIADISDAISAFQRAVELPANGHVHLPVWLNNLGISLLHRYEYTGDLRDVSKAVSAQQRAIQLSPNRHPNLPIFLSNLGTTFLHRFKQTRDLSDLSDAISVLQVAIHLTPNGHPDMPILLNNLGTLFSHRFDHVGDLIDITRALSYFQSTAQLTPDAHPDLPVRLDNLATSLLCCFEHTGDLNDISNAISAIQRAVKVAPDDHLAMAARENTLGLAFWRLFQFTGNDNDISDAVSSFQRAVDLAPIGHVELPIRLNNLGNSFLHRWKHTGGLADVYRAVSAFESAVQLTRDGHPNKPVRLSNLATSLSRLFECTVDLTYISGAISALQMAIQLTPDGHADMPFRLGMLGNSLLRLFERTGNLDDISSAISAQERAVRLTPNDHYDLPSLLNGLGDTLLRRFEHTAAGDSLDIDKAITIYSDCVGIISAPPPIRLRAALRLAKLSISRCPQESLYSYDAAICLLSQISGMDQTFRQRYKNLITTEHVTPTAVSTAFAQSDIRKALEWLEQGRCVVWNQIEQLRTPLDDLRVHDTELAQNFLEISRVLESSGSFESLHERTTLADTATAAQEWTRLLGKIRRLHGFHNFLKPLPASTVLKNLPQGGPVVLINVHEDRCDALALMPGCDTPLHIPLTHFTLQQASKLRDRLKNLVSPLRHGLRGRLERTAIGKTSSSIHTKSDIHVILQELWLCVVKPILEALGLLDKVSSLLICRTQTCSFIYYFYEAASF